MKMTVHSDINVLYIELREGEQARTLEVDPNTYIDLDAENRVLGIEVLNARVLGRFSGTRRSIERA